MTALFIDIKFAKMAGARIERGRLKNDNPFHFNGRCQVCGDSAQNKAKARFHMRTYEDTVMCSCFNCGLALPIGAYLKLYEPDLFSDYKFERYRTNGDDNKPVITNSVQNVPKQAPSGVKTLDLELVSEMDKDAPAALYVAKRKLPDYKFYYAEKFTEFSTKFNPELEGTPECPRLVIPFFDKKGNIYAYQGRDLTGKSSHKYLSVIVDKRMPLMFGLDRIDVNKEVLIVEGPLDALFLPNCIASVNASLVATANKLKPVVNNITLVFDNERRNKVIVAHYEAALKAGYKVVIWPDTLQQKDINEMILLGIDPLKIIKENTYQGLLGMMQLNKWKRI